MTRRKVLVVDDISLMRTMLRKYIRLIASSYFPNDPDAIEVLEAENGAEALSIMAKEIVDLVFLDLMMPEVSGLTFLEQRNEDDRLAAIPVVVTTALGEETGVDQARRLGITGYIRKPFTLEEVRRELEPILQGS